MAEEVVGDDIVDAHVEGILGEGLACGIEGHIGREAEEGDHLAEMLADVTDLVARLGVVQAGVPAAVLGTAVQDLTSFWEDGELNGSAHLGGILSLLPTIDNCVG